MNQHFLSRRNFLMSTGSLLLASCVAPTGLMRMNPSSNDYNTLRIFASSGFCPDRARVEENLVRWMKAGFSISNEQAAFRQYQRFAGTDSERAADLQQIAKGRVPAPNVLLASRGGYGAARIVDDIDWASLGAALREKGTLFLGYSDITVLQAALLSRGGYSSFAAPVLYDLWNQTTMQHCVRAISEKNLKVDFGTESLKHPIEGIFWGGNLSVLVSLIGTPYFPRVDGGILMIEETAEAPYRIDRMMQQLLLSGVLRNQKAIVIGDFGKTPLDVYDEHYTLSTIWHDVRQKLKIPVIEGFPFGHSEVKITLPLGTRARLMSIDGINRVEFLDYPVLRTASLNLPHLIEEQNSLI